LHVHFEDAGQNDPGNLNASGVLDLIPAGKRLIVDGGYANSDKCSGYNQFDAPQVKWLKKRQKSKQETYNSRMSNYKCMKGSFRHTGKEKFGMCLHAVVVLLQYAITDTDPESAEPLFDI